MLNPSNATITRPDGTPDATQVHLRYFANGSQICEVTVAANYIGSNKYLQSLSSLNASVPPQHQGATLGLTASMINDGGESAQKSCTTAIVVIPPPATPDSVEVSQ